MEKNKWVITPVLMTILALPGCMMLGMGGGMHGGSHDEMTHPAQQTLLIKEKTVGNIHIVAELPEVTVGKEVTYIVRLTSVDANLPLLGAEILGIIHKVPEERLANASHSSSTVKEAQGGTYVMTMSFDQPGEYDLIFEVSKAEGKNLDPPISIIARRIVGEDHTQKPQGFEITSAVIVGAAIMSVMMVWMIFGRI
jgi:hypothetical protein